RGAFIVLEGLDRSGKTTQAELLRERLRREGVVVEAARFPDRTTPTGQIINTYLTSSSSAPLPDQAIHLLFTANRWEAAPQLTSLLNDQHTTVVSDRYYYSGMVYSAAKENPALTLSWARRPEVGLPRPDLVVFLDLDGEEARRRGGWGEERYEKKEMQERVREVFWVLAGKKKGREDESPEDEAFKEEREDLVVVDAGGSVESVAEEVWKVV
ncbi:thymidylate kinase-domain-containing protein, partial [Coniella lustricola]